MKKTNKEVIDMGSKPIFFLYGKRVYLRPLLESDADGKYIHWLNSKEVCAGNSHHIYPYTKEMALEYIRRSQADREALILAVIVRKDHIHIGNIALQNINLLHRSAEFAILIGEKSYWGKGHALEASKLIMEHGFKALNLNRIYCGTYESNTGMRKLAEALGMRREGLRRKAAFKEGNFIDIIEFGLLESEFMK